MFSLIALVIAVLAAVWSYRQKDQIKALEKEVEDLRYRVIHGEVRKE